METAKIFKNGRSQAVRLPVKFRFEGDEVYIKKTSEGVLLMPIHQSIWDKWEDNLSNFDEPFIPDRNQPKHQERKELDEIFT